MTSENLLSYNINTLEDLVNAMDEIIATVESLKHHASTVYIKTGATISLEEETLTDDSKALNITIKIPN